MCRGKLTWQLMSHALLAVMARTGLCRYSCVCGSDLLQTADWIGSLDSPMPSAPMWWAARGRGTCMGEVANPRLLGSASTLLARLRKRVSDRDGEKGELVDGDKVGRIREYDGKN